jgi:hypothetical protein
MVLVAELDEILDVGLPTIDPMPHVVDVGELGVGATGEPASLVTPPDFHPLGVTGVPPGSPEVQAATIGPVGRNQNLGVTGEPACHFSRHRPHDIEFSAPLGSGEERQVGVDHHGRAIAACATGLTEVRALSGGPGVPGSICLANGDQGIGHPLLEGLSIAVLSTGTSNE